MYPIGFIANSQLAHNETNGGIPGVPNPPLNVTTVFITDVSFNIIWDAPTTDGAHGSPTSYLVYLNDTLIAYNLHSQSYSFSELTPDTGYTIAISAANATGEGEAATIYPGTLRSAPVLDSYSVDGTQVTVYWHRVDISVDSYVYYKTVDGEYNALEGTSTSPLTITLPSESTDYIIKIIAVDEFEMPLEVPVTTGGSLPPAFVVSFDSISDTSILFTFYNPQEIAADYVAILRDSNLDNISTFTYTVGGATSDTESISGLSGDTTYFLSLSTSNMAGTTYATLGDDANENIQIHTQVANGTLLDSNCVNGNVVNSYADGYGGTYSEVEGYNSSSCLPAVVYIEAEPSTEIAQLNFALHNPYYNASISGDLIVTVVVTPEDSNEVLGSGTFNIEMAGEETQYFTMAPFSGTFRLYPSITNATGTTQGVGYNTGTDYVTCSSLSNTYAPATVSYVSSTAFSFELESADGIYTVHYWKTGIDSFETSMTTGYTGGLIYISSLASSTQYTFRVINTTNTNEIVVINNSGNIDGSVDISTCSDPGQIDSSCVGSHLTAIYADGNCGTYSSVTDPDSDYCPLQDFYITVAVGAAGQFYYQFSNSTTKNRSFRVQVAQDVDFTVPISGQEGVTIGLQIDVMSTSAATGSIEASTFTTTGTTLYMRVYYENYVGPNYSLDGVNSTGERYVAITYSE